MVSKMKEVFIAKNGTPYVKDENGKVRFISSAELEQYKQENVNAKSRNWLLVGILIAIVTYCAYNIGGLL